MLLIYLGIYPRQKYQTEALTGTQKLLEITLGIKNLCKQVFTKLSHQKYIIRYFLNKTILVWTNIIGYLNCCIITHLLLAVTDKLINN